MGGPVPASLISLMTAYQALFLEGGLKKGQNVLIHAVRVNVTPKTLS